MDDFVVNVRQIGQYPITKTVGTTDLALLQQGVGGAYQSALASDFVSTALAGTAKDLLVDPGAGIAWNGALLVFSGGTLSFSQSFSVTG